MNKEILISSTSAVFISCLFSSCTSLQQKATENAMVQMEKDTGLKTIEVPNTEKQYLGKTHRNYKILFNGQAGNVWGRYAARVAMGEIGREVGSIMAFVTRGYEFSPGSAGSMLDRLLAKAIGQPLSITMILTHNKPNAPRLDVLSNYSTIQPEDPLPKGPKIGFGAGSIYSDNTAFVDAISKNEILMKRMKNMRCQYIRVDKDTVTLLWAGQENDYSAMIREHGGYSNMLNAFMDNLADIADAIP